MLETGELGCEFSADDGREGGSDEGSRTCCELVSNVNDSDRAGAGKITLELGECVGDKNAKDEAMDSEGEAVRDEGLEGVALFFSSCHSDTKWSTGAYSFP